MGKGRGGVREDSSPAESTLRRYVVGSEAQSLFLGWQRLQQSHMRQQPNDRVLWTTSNGLCSSSMASHLRLSAQSEGRYQEWLGRNAVETSATMPFRLTTAFVRRFDKHTSRSECSRKTSRTIAGFLAVEGMWAVDSDG